MKLKDSVRLFKKAVVVLCVGFMLTPVTGWGALVSLKTVPLPDVPNLSLYVRDTGAAVQLGKALFWDMQVGSDGATACATCHFHAGADSRKRNQVNPASGGFFPPLVPNGSLTAANFPFRKLQDPEVENSVVLRDCNDVVGSQGVVNMQFVDIQPGNPVDLGTPVPDPVFNVGGVNVRQVTGRNTPSVVNAVFNFANFWDGRANNVFNGLNPFGAADQNGKIFANAKVGGVTQLTPATFRLRNAAFASQAVGPPLSSVEMSWAGRTWPKLGKKMLSLRPLAQQVVHASDSVLGPLADGVAGTGLTTTYRALIRKAFAPKYWNNTAQIVTYDLAGVPTISPRPAGALTTSQFTQMEANFSLFFGLAVMLYESTLIADDSRFDQFLEGNGALTQDEQNGLTTFQGAGNCMACHDGGETTKATVGVFIAPVLPGALPNPKINPPSAIDFMVVRNGVAFYDVGFYNLGVRDTAEDAGRAGTAPFANPLVPGANVPLGLSELAVLKAGNLLPGPVRTYAPSLPLGLLPTDTLPLPGRTDSAGAFKTPGLRNVELTGPYFHNGGSSTLMQVVDFYTRGGDFTLANVDSKTPAITPIGKLRGSPARQTEVVAFLLTLTDERSRNESAPFDHPELFVPVNGLAPASDGTRTGFLVNPAMYQQIPAIGLNGRAVQGVAPLGAFLNLNPLRP